MKRMHGKEAETRMPASGRNEEGVESHAQGKERPQSRKGNPQRTENAETSRSYRQRSETNVPAHTLTHHGFCRGKEKGSKIQQEIA